MTDELFDNVLRIDHAVRNRVDSSILRVFYQIEPLVCPWEGYWELHDWINRIVEYDELNVARDVASRKQPWKMLGMPYWAGKRKGWQYPKEVNNEM